MAHLTSYFGTVVRFLTWPDKRQDDKSNVILLENWRVLTGATSWLLLCCYGFAVKSQLQKSSGEINYTTNFGSDWWHWSTPPADLQLTLSNTLQKSSIQLPSKLSPIEMASSFCGVGVMMGAVICSLMSFFRKEESWQPSPLVITTFSGVLFFLGWIMIQVDSPVIEISQLANCIVIKSRLGCFISRTMKFSPLRSPKIKFRGKYESWSSMNTNQLDQYPDYIVQVKGLMIMNYRFILRLNQSQGSWLVGGLNHWVAEYLLQSPKTQMKTGQRGD